MTESYPNYNQLDFHGDRGYRMGIDIKTTFFFFSGWFTIINEKSKTVEERDTVKLNGANRTTKENQPKHRANKKGEKINGTEESNFHV